MVPWYYFQNVNHPFPQVPTSVSLREENRTYMLIFNISAAICLFVIWLLTQVLGHFFPTTPQAVASLLIAAVVFLVGLVAELIDLKPRVFFIPVWVIGLLLGLRVAFTYGGIWIFSASLAIAAIGTLLVFMRKNPVIEDESSPS